MAVRERSWEWKGKTKRAWVVDYHDTKRARRLKTFKTKREAVDFAAKTHVDIKNGTHVADGDSVTVAEAGQLWLASCIENELERSSIERNRQHLELHIMPMIGTTKLNRLTVPAVRQFADRLRWEGRSKALTRMVVVSLGSILADAQERGLAMSNPVRELKRQGGKRASNIAEARRAPLAIGVDIPAPIEIRSILGAAVGHVRRRALIATAALTGLRSSELRGLRWQDVDFAKTSITVWQRADAWGHIGEAKSKAGYRTIPVPPLVINALREWKLACPKGKLALVFPNTVGNVESHQNIVQRDWHPVQIAAGVTGRVAGEDGQQIIKAKYSGLHALRHFFASWCAARREDGGLGLPLKTVQVRVGHASLAMTSDLYGHLFPSTDDAEVLAAGEAALLGTRCTIHGGH